MKELTPLIPPPGSFKELKQLHSRAYDRYWKERDCYEGDKMISTEAHLLKQCCTWLAWILQIAKREQINE